MTAQVVLACRVFAASEWYKYKYIFEFSQLLNGKYLFVFSQLLNGKYKEQTCLYVPRTYYGTSLHNRMPESGLLIENYVMRSELAEDGYPKMILNLRPDLDHHVSYENFRVRV
jgi:hypothetical protein